MQILSPIINESLFSYRSAYRLTALIMLAVGALVFLLIRNAPSSEASLSTSGKKQPKKPVHEGITLQQALRKPYFYVAAVCIFLTGMVLQGIVGSDANHMTHVGLDQASVAAALSIHSLALSGCKFLTGALYDRKGLKITMLICDCAALLTLLMLIFINDSSMGLTMAYGYSVMSAVALPLETIMLPLITAELFGQRSYAQMLGIISAINTIGFSFGPPFTNFVFDALGTYVPVFWAYALVMALVTAAFMYALSAAAKDREKASLAGGI